MIVGFNRLHDRFGRLSQLCIADSSCCCSKLPNSQRLASSCPTPYTQRSHPHPYCSKMAFISNAHNFTLGEGVYNNVQGNIVYNTFYGGKRPRAEIEEPSTSLEPMRKRRRREEDDEIEVFRKKDVKLTAEIGSGPGYFLHAGEARGRAVIVKVFNPGPTVREALMHPNVLRIEGISSPSSSNHFITYENARWQTAEGPLAAALKDDLVKSVNLGFKMVAGLSSGMNHLSVQGISLAFLRAENFDVFLDIGDRFLISINPPTSVDTVVSEDVQPEDNATRSWGVFNALCQKLLRSANGVLHNENIERNPVPLDLPHRPSITLNPGLRSLSAVPPSHESGSPENMREVLLPVPPRREYVWRTIDRGHQSLAAVAIRMTRELDLKLSTVNKLTWTGGEGVHRCAGYVREEITLATTAGDSAVVSHDSPSPHEICCVCHEVVGLHEVFLCICGDSGNNDSLRIVSNSFYTL
ncbi:hypothetical protein B0H19DRAFT_121294 [Mycena capillaripes]|nr:hypothetical protein B0H19DRAFT_121294 [Mycena capillaripes]